MDFLHVYGRKDDAKKKVVYYILIIKSICWSFEEK